MKRSRGGEAASELVGVSRSLRGCRAADDRLLRSCYFRAGIVHASRAKGNRLPARGQARPNIKGGLDDRAIASVALQ